MPPKRPKILSLVLIFFFTPTYSKAMYILFSGQCENQYI